MSGHVDQNLLLGVFALQMDLVTKEQLLEAVQVWVRDKSRPLAEILLNYGFLAMGDDELLLPLIARHLDQNEGDPTKSLKALSSVTPSIDVWIALP